MILTCHLLTGAAIALKIQPTPLALILAFLSHYLLDIIPHREYSIKNIFEKRWSKSFFDFLKVFLDIAFGALLILFLSKNQPIIYAGALFAILPDGFTFLALIFLKIKILRKHRNFHQNIIHFFKILENPVLLIKKGESGVNKKPPQFLSSKIWLGCKIFSQVLVGGLAIFFLIS